MNEQIDEILLRAVEIHTMAEGQVLTNASGCFYLENDYLYVITARHVVLDEPTNHRPDALELLVHEDAHDLEKATGLNVPLYRDDFPLWREHPRLKGKADLVAVPIEDPNVLANHVVSTFGPDDLLPDSLRLPVGQDVIIVGYPLGFHDSVHHLPLMRTAMIASVFGVPFKNQPYFLTDARLHRGTSGAPVIARLPEPTDVVGEAPLRWYLLGIHTAALDVSNRDPEQDEPLGLNCAWYASLISEIVHLQSTTSATPTP